jgi:DNA (cytosine-5)-methyltransferase 1
MKASADRIRAVDLFCGAGGSSTGLSRACAKLGLQVDLTAVNHWNIAIDTHSKNHPGAKHLCARLEAVEPLDHVPEGRLDLLLASPECTHHSTARGGRPMSDQSRASAWLVLKWAQELYVDTILIENVREFESWGPLGANGRPLPSKRGETFQAFLTALRSLGYRVEHRILNSADYGEATTRERMFLIARRGTKRISWPEPTHSPDADSQPHLFSIRKRWRPAREIIDWSIKGQSIFRRKKPLAPATIERIAAGIRKFCGPYAEPFLVILRNNCNAMSVDGPVPTVTAAGNHIGLCEPFVLGQQSHSAARSVYQPIPTIATAGKISVVQPFMVAAGGPEGKGRNPHSVEQPLSTVLTENHTALVQPFIAAFRGSHKGRNDGPTRTKSTSDPLPTQDTSNRFGLVEPFIMPLNHGAKDRRSHSMDQPMPTITTADTWSYVEPFLVKYNSTGGPRSVDEPVDTISTRDRYGLVQPVAIDILFRMLQPHELARAMGFDDDYIFAGSREQRVKQIGNAVSVRTAEALCAEILREKCVRHVSTNPAQEVCA